MIANKSLQDLIEKPFYDAFTPKHQLGPDYIIPSNDIRTWKADGAVHINPHPDPDPRFKPISVVTFFRKAIEHSPNRLALVVKRNNAILKWTYLEYYQSVKNAAKGFIKLGLAPLHAVAILGNNSPEWVMSYAAAIFCGGYATGIHTTFSAEACFNILKNISANIVIIDKKEQLDKILSIRHNLPQLKAIIQYGDKIQHPDIISWQDLILIGLSLPDEVLEKRVKGIAINQCCTILYTSGTTGNAKGVMISHDSVIFMVKSCSQGNMHLFGRFVSLWPLSHISALALDFYLAVLTESAVYFADPKGKLIGDLTQVQPTYFIGPPWMYEKIKEKLQAAEDSWPTLKKQLTWARKQAFANNEQILKSTSEPLIVNKVKKTLGLQHVKTFVSGGSPVLAELVQFFQGYGIHIQEGYGCSESSGSHIISTPKHLIPVGSIGNIQTDPKMEFKICNPDANGSGEILLRGRNICMGYLGLEEATKEAVEETKWFHTGDIGKINNDGFIFLTGRLKELIITAWNENIPPVPIEEKIKKLLPVISNCMLIGDSRQYLAVLLTLRTGLDLSTCEPTDQLDPIAVNWCQSVGSTALSVSQILQTADSNVMISIQQGINEYNEKYAISKSQTIQKWAILPQDFCISNGTLGPTAKLKRHFVLKKYHSTIEALYSS